MPSHFQSSALLTSHTIHWKAVAAVYYTVVQCLKGPIFPHIISDLFEKLRLATQTNFALQKILISPSGFPADTN